MRNLVIALAKIYQENEEMLAKMREEVPGENEPVAWEIITMLWPRLQGTRNEIETRKIAQLDCDHKAAGRELLFFIKDGEQL